MDREPCSIDRRFAVIGCGSIGKRHIANLKFLGVKDILAYDPQTERREEAARLGAATSATLDALWENRPEVCVITAPTALHLPLALEAAERGCHLFIEKPLSHEWSGVERLIDAVGRHKLITLVGCNMRFHPGLRKVKRLLERGAIGRVIAARVEAGQYLPDWHPTEDYRKNYSARRELGGGVILDAIHEIDSVRWLAGEAAAVVCFAEKLSRLEIDTEDTAALLVRFDSGAIGEVHVDYVQRAYSRTCQVIGEEGTLHWDYTTGQVRWYAARDRQWKTFANPAGWQANQMYLDEMSHFLRCLVGQERAELDVPEAARVLRIALAAKASAQGGRWIALDSRTNELTG